MNEGIISYAQNFEDVILWRALGHVGTGNYVDVGAQSAYEDSVSRAFHEHGWKGVHVEPVPFYADQLRQERPGDTIMQVMVGAEHGIGELFAMPGTGLSTSREDLAEGYARDGRDVHREVVPVVTLDQVLDVVEGEIHWLKIDVEGAEQQVLQGWRGSRRPWVVVIESTRPMSQEQNYEDWDPLVTSKGYRFVYFDGLNRFYVSSEHPELADAFGVGPNVFDRFSLSGSATSTFTSKLKHDASLVADELARLSADHAHACAERARMEGKVAELERLVLEQRLEFSERERSLLAEQSIAHARVSGLQEQLAEEKLRSMEAVAVAVKEVSSERDLALAQVAKLHGELLIIHNSTSWVVTAPLRVLSRGLRSAIKAPVFIARSIRPMMRRIAYGVLRRAARSPQLKRVARRLLASMPALDARVRASYQASMGRAPTAPAPAMLHGADSSAVLGMLSSPLPNGVSAQAKQSLLRLRHAIAGVKS